MVWGTDIFRGMVPRLDERLLKPEQAKLAKNCRLAAGTCAPVPLPKPTGINVGLNDETIYRFSDTQWFAWNRDVDVVPAPIQDDTLRRTYWTGDGYPKMTTTTIMGSFVSPGQPVSRRLGIPAPEDALTVSLQSVSTFSAITQTVSTVTFGANLKNVLVSHALPASFFLSGGAPSSFRVVFNDLNDKVWFNMGGGLVGGRRLKDDVRDSLSIRIQASTYDFTLSGWTVANNDPSVLESSQTMPDGFYDYLQATGTPVTVTLDVASGAGDTTPETHAWVYTWVSDLGEEGPPSPPSAHTTRAYGHDGDIQGVRLTMATGVTGPYGINRKRIYRTAIGSDGTTSFQFLAEISSSQSTYTDTKQGSELGEAIQSTFWDPPPDGLEGLILGPSGIVAGFEGRDVYLSEPYQGHAWPRDYVQTVGDDIVGLGAFGATIVVLTKGKPVLLLGAHPATMATVPAELDQACVSKRSISRIGQQGIVYASPDGLVLIGPGGGKLISRAAFSLKEWREFLGTQEQQARMMAFYHDNQYVMFLHDKAVSIDPEEGDIIEYDRTTRAGFHDRDDDKIYVVETGGGISEWKTVAETGDTLAAMAWKCGTRKGRNRNYAAAQVIAKNYPVQLVLFFDTGQKVYNVASRAPFRLWDRIPRASKWCYELRGTNEVEEVRLGGMREMLGSARQAAKALSLPDIGPYTWPEGTAVNVQLPAATASEGTPTIAYSVAVLPEGLSVAGSPPRITGTPLFDERGTLLYTAQAEGYVYAQEAAKWTVTRVEKTLSLPDIGSLTWEIGETVDTQLPVATASFGSPSIVYTLAGLPSGLSFDADTRRITGTTGAAASGTLVYRASASRYTSASRSIEYGIGMVPSNALTWRGQPLTWRDAYLTWR